MLDKKFTFIVQLTFLNCTGLLIVMFQVFGDVIEIVLVQVHSKTGEYSKKRKWPMDMIQCRARSESFKRTVYCARRFM